MDEQHVADDQSHYEISLTAGQAFVAFILLLLSLGSAFAFGLMIGRGQSDERLVVRREAPPAVTEATLAPKKSQGEIVELGVAADEFTEPDAGEKTPSELLEETTEPAADADRSAPVVIEEAARADSPAIHPADPAPVDAASAAVKAVHYAQLLSTADQKTAEALAVKVINGGFSTAYVERGATDKGAVYRVRVRFESEADARAAEAKLKAFASEVWITSK